MLGLGLASAEAASALKPRVAQQRGFTRVVLDLESSMSYRVEALGSALRLIVLGAAADAALIKVGNAEISTYTAAQGGGNAVFTFLTPQGVSNRGGYRLSSLALPNNALGQRLVLDISGGFVDLSPLGPVKPLELRAFGSSVLLDAGHGGKDSGAIGYVTEEPLNLEVAGRVGRWLSDAGVKVSYSRSDHGTISENKTFDLASRANLAAGKSLFVSIHANAIAASKQSSNCGSEVYYFGPKSEPLLVPFGPAPALLPPPNNIVLAPLPVAPVTVQLANTPIGPAAPIIAAPIPTSPASLDPTQLAAVPTTPASLIDPTLSNPALSTPTPVNSAVTSTVAEDSASQALNTGNGAFSLVPDGATNTISSLLNTPAGASIVTGPSTNTASAPKPPAPSVTLSSEGEKLRQEQSKFAASKVLSSLLGSTAASNRGVRTAPFYVIKNNTVPAILVEMGFVTHPVEGMALSDTNYLDRIAYGIARGIVDYLNENPITTE
jgi:N-acetylmuramoyl-L-alanine amidase